MAPVYPKLGRSPARWQGAALVWNSTGSAMHTLFLSANVDPDSPLAVDKEFNRVRERLRAVDAAWASGIDHWPDIRLEQLPGRLLDHAHAILHFSGHCGADGAVHMRDLEARTVPLDPHGLADLIGEFSDSVRLVVLNACFSEALAVELVKRVEVVVGMRTVVSDHAGVVFAPAFYEALASGRSVGKAFKIAKALVATLGKDQARTLQCHTRTDIDADQVFIAIGSPPGDVPPPNGPEESNEQQIGPRKIGNIELTLKDKDTLTALLMRCAQLQQPGDRQAVYGRLPVHLQGQLGAGGNLISAMTSLVGNCARYPDGIDQLIDAVRHFERGSLLMAEIDAWTWTVRGG